ncbi:hypothetical protein XELAEV_18020101mg [Xenopus laevis]|uniref:Uncharacterized protein n=1 Tax=Xenopus laevis TaxID=8355 RepID=A0A974HQQ3_XENLA|nr:hypothetical protein XELAEV_18020101mg [Xenopus laevis]
MLLPDFRCTRLLCLNLATEAAVEWRATAWEGARGEGCTQSGLKIKCWKPHLQAVTRIDVTGRAGKAMTLDTSLEEFRNH